ncbi:MAG: hypothetical protein COU10_01410 [Candidatus Harrisonbacteria bacterium CG10_big_fil_rev_8_21_14_0_10_45_28]|uniref:Uncharacterized protein n=1 Tax=Candidatus Harrisonbacteria bacterium CG10_big_fil_rev_8_21_14_0_10_45_28 TaxID=1974586 RepID=A0A2H0UNN3_9BACT|nr:MAG: hypothetical protein COU10_01410 [Candidatus Harrisonbacteria bacterium CG10_big_fil_rev_8_21_14_0_10_45_28]
MEKIFPLPESKNEIMREEVINAYKKFVEQGIKSPDALDLDDPEVKEANELFYRWQTQEDTRAKGNEELSLRIHLAKTMLYVDAGFTDPNYLDEILKDWLVQDAQNAEKQNDNPARIETRKQLAEAMKKIRNLLKEQT